MSAMGPGPHVYLPDTPNAATGDVVVFEWFGTELEAEVTDHHVEATYGKSARMMYDLRVLDDGGPRITSQPATDCTLPED